MARWKNTILSVVRRENLFVDTFSEVSELYKETNVLEAMKDRGVISIRDSDNATGLFVKTDIIIQYDMESELPMVIAERVFKENYSRWTYRKYWHQCCTKLKASSYERVEGCNRVWKLKLTEGNGYFDIIYYDEGWYECARERALRAQLG